MPEEKLRMLIVGAFPRRRIIEHGGVLTSCRVLMASSLPERVDLVLIDSSAPSVPPPPVWRRVGRAMTRVVQTGWQYLRARPHVALLFASPGLSFIEKSLMAALGRMFGVKILMFPRGAQLIQDYRSSRLKAAGLKALFAIPHRILCQGRIYHDFFTDAVGFDGGRCPILPNWTATPELLQIGALRNYPADNEALTVLFLGWIDTEKGVYELLQVVRDLSRRDDLPRVRLVLAGEGAALEDVGNFVRDYALEALVDLPGWIDEAAKIAVLRDADIFVLPSYMEGMPNALIEAMAAGLPSIATSVGAVGDMVDDGQNGLIIPPRDVQSLSAALETLLRNPELRARLGRAARYTAAEKFSAESAVDRLIALSEGIVRGRSGPRVSARARS